MGLDATAEPSIAKPFTKGTQRTETSDVSLPSSWLRLVMFCVRHSTNLTSRRWISHLSCLSLILRFLLMNIYWFLWSARALFGSHIPIHSSLMQFGFYFSFLEIHVSVSNMNFRERTQDNAVLVKRHRPRTSSPKLGTSFVKSNSIFQHLPR